MLKMSGERAVDRPRRPAIAVGAGVFDLSVASGALDARLQLRTDLAQHRLDRQNHPLAQLDPASTAAVVVDLRILVHPAADSVADEVANHVEPARLGVLLHRRADIANVLAGPH